MVAVAPRKRGRSMSNAPGKALVFWYDGASKYYEYENIEDLEEYIRGCYPEVSGYTILEEGEGE
jgi:hypothetical protein